ncbi:hypothetical protein NKG94_31185 [Micromonospora sp. M12]
MEVAAALAASAVKGDIAAARTLQAAATALSASDPSVAADLCSRALQITPDEDPLRGRWPLKRSCCCTPPDGQARARTSPTGAAAVHARRPGGGGTAGPRRHDRARAGRPSSRRSSCARTAVVVPTLRARHLAVLTHNLLMAGEPEQSRALVPDARDMVVAVADPTAAFVSNSPRAGWRTPTVTSDAHSN